MARVLIVDDDEQVAQSLAQLLEGWDLEVRHASNGKEALRGWEGNPPDLVITDILMPEMDGYQLMVALRQRGWRPAIIAMSSGGAHSDSLYLETARYFGASTVLLKPFSRSQLMDAVTVALGRAPGPPAQEAPR